LPNDRDVHADLALLQTSDHRAIPFASSSDTVTQPRALPIDLQIVAKDDNGFIVPAGSTFPGSNGTLWESSNVDYPNLTKLATSAGSEARAILYSRDSLNYVLVHLHRGQAKLDLPSEVTQGPLLICPQGGAGVYVEGARLSLKAGQVASAALLQLVPFVTVRSRHGITVSLASPQSRTWESGEEQVEAVSKSITDDSSRAANDPRDDLSESEASTEDPSEVEAEAAVDASSSDHLSPNDNMNVSIGWSIFDYLSHFFLAFWDVIASAFRKNNAIETKAGSSASDEPNERTPLIEVSS
jgi:hypothetical protein